MEEKQTEFPARLYADFQVKTVDHENWLSPDLEYLYQSIALFAQAAGGSQELKHHLGEVLVERADTGTSLGLAYKDRIKLSKKNQLSAWSIIHELAHVWDAKNQWKLSLALEKYTEGYTNTLLSSMKKWMPSQWDAGAHGAENKPGYYGRKPGVNAAGYFYGDTPSGANWNFNRKEDFAESVVMYCGWERNNALSKTAHGRIERYLLPNGTKDPIYNIADNWSDYVHYFYPKGGDYTKTKRWKFINGLMQHGIQI